MLALSDFKFPISTVFSLSSTFCPSLAISELLAEAGIRLLNLFGDAPSVMRHPAKLKKLKRLPQSAMLALLLSDKLTTDAEATVLQLLLAWYTCNKSSCDEDELEELKAGVRYSRLTPAYLCGMLPLLPEPEFAVTIEEANHLRLDASFRGEFEAEERQRLNGPCPKGWFLAERPFLGSSSADNFIKVRLKIPQNELLLHVAAVSKMRGGGTAPEGILSPRVYGCGYDWRISLVSRDVDQALGVQLHVMLPSDDKTGYVVAHCTIKMMLPHETHARPHEQVMVSNNLQTWLDMFGVAEQVLGGDSSLGPWAKYLINGHLIVEAEIVVVCR